MLLLLPRHAVELSDFTKELRYCCQTCPYIYKIDRKVRRPRRQQQQQQQQQILQWRWLVAAVAAQKSVAQHGTTLQRAFVLLAACSGQQAIMHSS
jgi:hypothetical protein